jgi:hypothetical protein
MPPATVMLTPPWKFFVFGRPVMKAAPDSTMRSVISRPWQRQRDDPLLLDHRADACAPHVHDRRRGFNRHRFLEVADREHGVDRGRGATCSTTPVCT